jgi:hypothetical protein
MMSSKGKTVFRLINKEVVRHQLTYVDVMPANNLLCAIQCAASHQIKCEF